MQERLRHDALFGRALASVRRRHDLRQTDIPGLSARQLSRIESGSRPRAATLRQLATAHGLDTNVYLNEIAEVINSLKDG